MECVWNERITESGYATRLFAFVLRTFILRPKVLVYSELVQLGLARLGAGKTAKNVGVFHHDISP